MRAKVTVFPYLHAHIFCAVLTQEEACPGSTMRYKTSWHRCLLYLHIVCVLGAFVITTWGKPENKMFYLYILNACLRIIKSGLSGKYYR